jgi:hypothetical protein
MPNLVISFNWTPIFESYVVRCGFKNTYPTDMLFKEIGLHAHTIRNPCFLSCSKKRRKLSNKTGMMSTKHHLKSDQPKHAKDMAKFALNMDNVYLDVPMLTSLCLVVVIPMS